MGVSLNTVRTHLQRVLRKTGTRSHVALAALLS
jgi:DNA-binding CsgD family transcriptional regulator